MRIIIYFLYNLFVIPVLYFVFHIGYFFNDKVKKGIQGRKKLFETMKRDLQPFIDRHPRFWIHCSSMGEFEQSKPLIRKLKEKYPNSFVILSFFSPSAFEHIHEYDESDYNCYLPFDSRRRAAKFIAVIKPDIALIVRHDLWLNYLYQLKKLSIPAVLINSTIHRNKGYEFFYQIFERVVYRNLSAIFTISEETKKYFTEQNIFTGKIKCLGDTRFDQVIRRASDSCNVVKRLEKIIYNRKVFIAGSTWPADERVILKAVTRVKKEGIRVWLVLIPHEPDTESIKQIEAKAEQYGLTHTKFTELNEKKNTKTDILIVDKVGVLAALYSLGDLCFVGGAFGPGIHNVLEPAAHGKIIVFGPKNSNSFEAQQFKNRGVAFEVSNSDDLYSLLSSTLTKTKRLKTLGKKARNIVNENIGTSDRIVQQLRHMYDLS
ncbi:MAG: glycosyltransferase N-terminal domain-containing protein [bacterium]